MASFDDFDWTKGSDEQQLVMARTGNSAQLCTLARRYDWNLYPEPVLGWVMAQKDIDLGTALSAFLNGEPERFNYMPKSDVPKEFCGAARVLDNICLRINSGFYLAHPERGINAPRRVKKWLSYQAADRDEGRRGRWVLDEQVLGVLLDNALRHDRSREARMYHEEPSLLRDLFSPVMELGVLQRVMRMLPNKSGNGRAFTTN